MTCASCVLQVEKALSGQRGVEQVDVNLATNTAQVAWDDALLGVEGLQAAVRKAGYELLVTDGGEAIAEAEQARAGHLAQLRGRLIAASLLSLPLVVVGMAYMHAAWSPWVQWLLSTPVVLVFGRQFFVHAWKQARHGSANMDTLVALSTGIAYIFSVFNTLNPSFWTERGLQPHVYFEAAAVVITFILLGKFLEERAKAGTGAAIRKLMGLRPDRVHRVGADGAVEEVNVDQVDIGDLLIVRPGESLAVDGEVLDGESYVDESMISGEPVPVLKEAGNAVLAGTINQKGSFRMRAQRVGAATVLARIINTVQQAQGSKAPVQNMVDRIASVFVPVVIAIALLSAATWWVIGGEHAFTQGSLALITVLVIACPCALGLATPTAIMAGIGKGAETGILIKDAESLERARKVTAVVLDKTGTITEGRPMVVETEGLNEARSRWILLGIEQRSEHPLADAVVRFLNEGEGVFHFGINRFESHTGKGVSAEVDGMHWLVGNRRLLEENDVLITAEWRAHERRWQELAYTVIWLADTTAVRAAIAIADPVKTSAADAIAKLKRRGIKVYMQTGDARRTAQAVAAAVGIEEYRSEVLPKDKAAFVAALQSQGHVVAMVGDGINDSEALAQADVSVAMGKGSDIAMEVAQMTLMSSDLQALPKALRLSERTVNVIRQNLFWAFIYNVVGIPVAAGVLYPLNGFLLDPMFAGAAMAMSSVSVVSNSLRLRWARL